MYCTLLMELLGSSGQKIMTKHYVNISEVLYSQVSSNSPTILNQQIYKWKFCRKQDLVEKNGGTKIYSFSILENNFKCRFCWQWLSYVIFVNGL